ncbi:MAG: hypothetical protein JSW27_00310 [Phycisphaerales bacterium]|nr:MAG: hypothetical protein JSW27_00310 [Phycisphaerales bacterium]
MKLAKDLGLIHVVAIASGTMISSGLFILPGLAHLARRVLAKELIDGTLDHELKSIVRERDQIELDRFDTLIEQAVALDLDGAMDVEAFFTQAAAQLAPRLEYDPERLRQCLLDRERDTSAVFSPFLAVPPRCHRRNR